VPTIQEQQDQMLGALAVDLDPNSATLLQDAQSKLRANPLAARMGITAQQLADRVNDARNKGNFLYNQLTPEVQSVAVGMQLDPKNFTPDDAETAVNAHRKIKEGKIVKVPFTAKDGRSMEVALIPDTEAPGSFKIVQVPGLGPAIGEKKSLVQIGSAGERKDLTQAKVLLGKLEEVQKDWPGTGVHITGPLNQFIAGLGRMFGQVPQEWLDYEVRVSEIGGAYRHELFGSALSEGERKSAKQFIAEMSDWPDVHQSKLRVMEKNTRRFINEKEKSMGLRAKRRDTMSDMEVLQHYMSMGATEDEAIDLMLEEELFMKTGVVPEVNIPGLNP
jgi:hypothetical protein